MNTKKDNLRKIISTILVTLLFIQMLKFSTLVKATDTYEGLNLEVTKITSLNAGDTVEITISTDGEPIGSIDAYITYNFSIFEQITEDDVECLQKDWRVDQLDYDEDSYGENTGYLIISNNKGKTNTGDIAKITLTIKETTTSTRFIMTETYVVLEDNSSVGPLEDLICEMKATIKYSITYNSNTTDTVTNMPEDGIKEENSDYIIGRIPTREGYSFIGWNTKEDGSGINYATGSTYTANENLTLYAQWKKQTTLTVNPNGGVWEGSSLSQTFTQNEGTTKTINNPTTTPNGNRINFNANGGIYTGGQIVQTTTFDKWTGATLLGTTYTFGTSNATLTANYVGDEITLPTATKVGSKLLGWQDSKGNLVGKAGETYAPTYTTPNAIVTLSAKWEAEEYILTINPNGGTYNGNRENTTLKGTYTSTVTMVDPVKEGYTITLDNNDGTGTTSEKIQTYTFSGWTVVSGTGTISEKTYTFSAEDGEIKANYTANKVELETLIREGYTFNGWYTASTGGTKVENQYTPTSDITLYAQWTKNIFTITFDAGEDATIDITSKQIEYGSEYGTLPTPTKEGYIFKVWKDKDGQVVTEKDIVTGDKTLTAEWEEVLYLKSTEYLIGKGVNPEEIWNPGQETQYADGDLYIKGIRPRAGIRLYANQVPSNEGTYLEELLSNLNTNADEIKVYIPEDDSNGNVILKEENIVGNDTLIGTAMIIKLTKGEQEIQLTLIVRGDLIETNKTVGDGKITNTEAARLKTLSNYTLTKNYTKEEQQALDYYINTDNRWSTNKQAIIRAYQEHTLADMR